MVRELPQQHQSDSKLAALLPPAECQYELIFLFVHAGWRKRERTDTPRERLFGHIFIALRVDGKLTDSFSIYPKYLVGPDEKITPEARAAGFLRRPGPRISARDLFQIGKKVVGEIRSEWDRCNRADANKYEIFPLTRDGYESEIAWLESLRKTTLYYRTIGWGQGLNCVRFGRNSKMAGGLKSYRLGWAIPTPAYESMRIAFLVKMDAMRRRISGVRSGAVRRGSIRKEDLTLKCAA